MSQQINIRDAVEADIPALLVMAERFIEEAWSRINVPYCRESCEALLRNLIDSDLGILLISSDQRSMMGAIVYPWHFNRAILTGQELFWYAEPGCKAGLALMEEAERRARGLGAETFNMAAIEHMRGPVLERLYKAKGYAPSERIFIRELA